MTVLGSSRALRATRMSFPAAATGRSAAIRTAMPASRRFAASTVGRCTICRRTARSLMAAQACRSEHAERVLGHAIVGVAGVYNRHAYSAEIADALKRLARLIEDIVDGEPDNVVPFIAQ